MSMPPSFRPSRTGPSPKRWRRIRKTPGDGRSPSRLLGIGARGAERMAAATGIDDAVERTTEEAIVRALESPAVERAIVRVLESEAAQDALERTLSSPAVERAAVKVLDSELVDHVWDRLLRSDEAQKLIERIAEAPELQAAIASQGVGLLRDIGRQIRAVAGRLDNGLERFVRRVIGRPRTQPTDHIGLIARVSAAVLDGVILNGIFSPQRRCSFVFSALGDPEGVGAAGIVFGLGSWIVFGSVYLLTFWAAAGQHRGCACSRSEFTTRTGRGGSDFTAPAGGWSAWCWR